MSVGMPEVGTKMSLISMADIRYEGHLYTFDPNQNTIALACVRSFGTEDRDTKTFVPPQSQIYDYILFRGTDIKHIRLIPDGNTLLNDPAIMQLSAPPSLGASKPAAAFTHPILNRMFSAGGGVGGGSGSPRATARAFHQRNAETQANGSRSLNRSRRNSSRGDGNNLRLNNYNQNRNRSQSRNNGGNWNRHPNNRGRQGNQHHNNQRGGNGRSRSRSGAFRFNQNAQNRPQNGAGGDKANKMKFEGDYDFEQANTEFEELCNKLDKTKLDNAEPSATTDDSNKENEEKSSGGDLEPFYNKSKSFFDNISCESVERSKGRTQKTDWRKERKLNTETFGVPAARRGGNNNYHRGGGGGGRGNNYRGYRPRYHRNNYHKHNHHNDNHKNNQQQQSSDKQQQDNKSDATATGATTVCTPLPAPTPEGGNKTEAASSDNNGEGGSSSAPLDQAAAPQAVAASS